MAYALLAEEGLPKHRVESLQEYFHRANAAQRLGDDGKRLGVEVAGAGSNSPAHCGCWRERERSSCCRNRLSAFAVAPATLADGSFSIPVRTTLDDGAI